jgi:hypothetical protein
VVVSKAVANPSHFIPVPGGVDIITAMPHNINKETIRGIKNRLKKTSLITGSC